MRIPPEVVCIGDAVAAVPNAFQELASVLVDLEALQQQGIRFDAAMFGGSRSDSSSSTNARTRTAAHGRSTGRKQAAGSRGRPGSTTRKGTAAASGTSRGPWAGRRRQHSRGLPPFDELSAEELYELLMDSSSDHRTAKAARAWVQEAMAAKRMNPSIASSLAFLMAMDYITQDFVEDPRDFVFGELFDAGSDRYKGRARAGSAYDYVKYSSAEGDSSDSDEEEDTSVWAWGLDDSESDDEAECW